MTKHKTRKPAATRWARFRRRLKTVGLVLNLATVLYAGAVTPIVVQELDARAHAAIVSWAFMRQAEAAPEPIKNRAEKNAQHVASAVLRPKAKPPVP